jgi:hypothetical protein
VRLQRLGELAFEPRPGLLGGGGAPRPLLLGGLVLLDGLVQHLGERGTGRLALLELAAEVLDPGPLGGGVLGGLAEPVLEVGGPGPLGLELGLEAVPLAGELGRLGLHLRERVAQLREEGVAGAEAVAEVLELLLRCALGRRRVAGPLREHVGRIGAGRDPDLADRRLRLRGGGTAGRAGARDRGRHRRRRGPRGGRGRGGPGGGGGRRGGGRHRGGEAARGDRAGVDALELRRGLRLLLVPPPAVEARGGGGRGRRRRGRRVGVEERGGPAEEIGEVERLLEVVVGAGPRRAVGVDRRVGRLAGVEDERHRGERALQPVADREAAHVRQLGGEQDQVRRRLLAARQRRLARLDRHDREPGRPEGAADLFREAGIRLDQEYVEAHSERHGTADPLAGRNAGRRAISHTMRLCGGTSRWRRGAGSGTGTACLPTR